MSTASWLNLKTLGFAVLHYCLIYYRISRSFYLNRSKNNWPGKIVKITIDESKVAKIWRTSLKRCKTVHTKSTECGHCKQNWIINIHTVIKSQVSTSSYAFRFDIKRRYVLNSLPTVLFSGRGGIKMPLNFSKRRSRSQTKSLYLRITIFSAPWYSGKFVYQKSHKTVRH